MSTSTIFRCTLVCLAIALPASSAHAILFRAYLASDGSDANPCTLAAPCRLLPAALNAVADGGEVWMLDSANYNTSTVNIYKSVSILAVPGAVGSIVATGGPAVQVAASGIAVALRNVVIVPLYQSGGTTGTHGAVLSTASTLVVEHSLIANLPGVAVLSEIGGARVRIVNSILRGNGSWGLVIRNGVHAEVASTQMLGNYGGVNAYGTSASTTTITVSDSVISGGTEGAFAHSTAAGAVTKITITRSTISHTVYPLKADSAGATSIISANACTVTFSEYPWYVGGASASIRTMGNNQFTDNLYAGVGSLTYTALQ